MNQTLCRYYRDPDGPRKENDPSEERPKLSVLFSGSSYPKLSSSITTDKLARSELIAGNNGSLREQELDTETENFGCCLLRRAALNWMMKCDGQ